MITHLAKHCVILATGCHTCVKASCSPLAPNCSPELAHTHAVRLLVAAQHRQTNGTDNLTDTAAGTRCRCCKTAGGNENTRTPVFQTGANLPLLCKYPDAARLNTFPSVTRRLIQMEKMTAPPWPLLSQYSTLAVRTFLLTGCFTSFHRLKPSDRARPQTQTRSQDSEQDGTSPARSCVHFVTSMHSNSVPRGAGGRVPLIRSGERKMTE